MWVYSVLPEISSEVILIFHIQKLILMKSLILKITLHLLFAL